MDIHNDLKFFFEVVGQFGSWLLIDDEDDIESKILFSELNSM